MSVAILPKLRTLPKPVWIFLAANIFLGLICVLLMHGPISVRVVPYLPRENFWDFRVYFYRFAFFHQTDFFAPKAAFYPPGDTPTPTTFEYPAPIALLYGVFYVMGKHCIKIYVCTSLLFVFGLLVLFGKKLVALGVDVRLAAVFIASTVAFSFPGWFEFILGNLEVWIFLMLAGAIFAYFRGRVYFAAVLIGIATSMKIFPGVYLALFLSRKQYKQFAVGILTAVVTNIVALWAVCPSISVSYKGIQDGLAFNRSYYMLNFLGVETGFDHSLFGFFKRFAHHLVPHDTFPPIALTIYMALAALAGLILYFFRIRKLPILNQVLCLCIAMVLLPPTSHDYTLLHLYVPWALLVFYAIRHNTSPAHRGIVTAFVCFAIAFSPEDEFVFHISAQIKAVALVVLLITALRFPLEESFDAGAATLAPDREPLHM